MLLAAQPVPLDDILPLREEFRAAHRLQLVHDSIHGRPGWTRSYLVTDGDSAVGYGAVAVAGPWAGEPTLIEMFLRGGVMPRAFEAFEAVLAASQAVRIETQSNVPLLATMLQAFGTCIQAESVLFEDSETTALPNPGIEIRPAGPEHAAAIAAAGLDDGARLVALDGRRVVATAGFLLHYNKPYADVYMAVAPDRRRHGVGAYMVQEAKAQARAAGHEPAARCRADNEASRRTLTRAGFAPCGCILAADVRRRVT